MVGPFGSTSAKRRELVLGEKRWNTGQGKVEDAPCTSRLIVVHNGQIHSLMKQGTLNGTKFIQSSAKRLWRKNRPV
jgi:hypothetical protein